MSPQAPGPADNGLEMGGHRPHVVVVDASAIVKVLLDNGPIPPIVHGQLAGIELIAPHLIDPEVLSATRNIVSRRTLTERDGAAVLRDFRRTPIERFPHSALLEGAWSFRHNVSPYDAMYVALARAVSVPLVTTDAHLARAAASLCDVRILK